MNAVINIGRVGSLKRKTPATVTMNAAQIAITMILAHCDKGNLRKFSKVI